MLVRFHTNLDEAHRYISQFDGWNLPMPPRVGDELTFEIRKGFTFLLQVVAVRWEKSPTETVARVELHLPSSWGSRSIKDWMDWMDRRIRGGDR